MLGIKIMYKKQYEKLLKEFEQWKGNYEILQKKKSAVDKDLDSLRVQLNVEIGKVQILRDQLNKKSTYIAKLEGFLNKQDLRFEDHFKLCINKGKCDLCDQETKVCRKLTVGKDTVCILPISCTDTKEQSV